MVAEIVLNQQQKVVKFWNLKFLIYIKSFPGIGSMLSIVTLQQQNGNYLNDYTNFNMKLKIKLKS